MKKLISVILILTTVLCLTSCNGDVKEDKIKEEVQGTFVYGELLWYRMTTPVGGESIEKTNINKLAFKYENNKLTYASVEFEVKDIVIKKLNEEEKIKLSDTATYYKKSKSEKKVADDVKKMNIYSITFKGDAEKSLQTYRCYYNNGEIWSETEQDTMFRLKKDVG